MPTHAFIPSPSPSFTAAAENVSPIFEELLSRPLARSDFLRLLERPATFTWNQDYGSASGRFVPKAGTVGAGGGAIAGVIGLSRMQDALRQFEEVERYLELSDAASRGRREFADFISHLLKTMFSMETEAQRANTVGGLPFGKPKRRVKIHGYSRAV